MKETRVISSTTYPLWILLMRILPPIATFTLILIYSSGGIRVGEILFVFVTIILCYLIGQYRYSRINIYNTHLEQIYLASFYLKPKNYFFSDLEFSFFKFDTGRYGDPVVFLYFKNGNKKKIFMPKRELEYIRQEFKDLNIVVETAKNLFDKPR